MSSPASAPHPSRQAEGLFADWLSRRNSANPLDFEELCLAHPELAPELRQLHSDWKRIDALVRKAGLGVASSIGESLARRLAGEFGSGLDPQVSLHTEEEKSSTPPTSQLIERLKEHSLKTSRYRLHGEIARGGMGAILKVWDEDLRRSLAMKVILGKGEGAAGGETPPIDRRLLARFLEEAQVTGQLDHPGIVPVHELGLDAEKRVYFTMKLVKGRDLKLVFDLVFEDREGWSETRALGVLLKVCEAMAYAHQKGVIHRDLKPANVMVGNFGEVYVMDWGLARVLGHKDTHDLRLQPLAATSSLATDRREERHDAPDSPLFTMDGDVVGTPCYMPPEQARGEIERLSPRSDVYSIGAMLYHLLARQMPYCPPDVRVTNRTVLGLVLHGPPAPLENLRKDVPVELAAICDKAMARAPEERYADTQALAEDLRAYLEGRVVRAFETGAWAETRKWVARNKLLAASLSAALVLLVAGSWGIALVQAAGKREAAREREVARSNELRAKESERVALEQTRESETRARQAYLATMRATDGAIRLGDYASARRSLEAAPEEYRDWEWRYQDAQMNTSLLHLPEARAVCAFSPDGRRLLTGCSGNDAVLWDVSTGAEVLRLQGHEKSVVSARFNSDGTRILTSSWDATARIWDSATGAQVLVLKGHAEGVGSAVFSPDESRVLTASWDGTARVWDATTGSSLLELREPDEHSYPGEKMGTTDAAFCSDGARILSASWHGVARLWDASCGDPLHSFWAQSNNSGPAMIATCLATGIVLIGLEDGSARLVDTRSGSVVSILEGHKSMLTDVALSRDGSRSVTSSWDRTARVWETESGTEVCVLRHLDGVHSTDISADGQWVLTTSEDGTARIWSSATGEELSILGGHQPGSDGTSDVYQGVFSPDASRVATVGMDGVRLWGTPGHDTRVLRTPSAAERVAFSPDSVRLATSSDDGIVRVWDVFSRDEVLEIRHSSRLKNARFAPAGSHLLTFAGDCAQVWESATGLPVAIMRGHERGITLAEFSPDGSRVLTGATDGTARLWNVETGKLELVLPGHYWHFYSAGFSSDGARIVTLCHANLGQGTLARLWDANSGAELCKLEGVSQCAAFSCDGRFLATERNVWRAATCEKIGTLVGHKSNVWMTCFSRDGSKLLTASGDSTARLWDPESGNELASLRGHAENVWWAAFDRDEARVATASGDGTARIWDAETGTELAVLDGHEGPVRHLEFSPDGRCLATASDDGTVRLWDTVRPAERLREQRELEVLEGTARSVVEKLRQTSEDWLEIAGRLRALDDLDPTLKGAALRLVTRLARPAVDEARQWVEQLYREFPLREEVCERIANDSSRAEPVRRAAWRLAEFEEDEGSLDEHAWIILAQPEGKTPEELERGLLLARRAAELFPSSHNLTTLGLAQFRTRRFTDAVATLEGVRERVGVTEMDEEDPRTLGILAMANHELGNLELARQLFDLMRAIADQWDGVERVKELVAEAEARYAR